MAEPRTSVLITEYFYVLKMALLILQVQGLLYGALHLLYQRIDPSMELVALTERKWPDQVPGRLPFVLRT